VTIEKPASFFVPLIMMNTNFLEASRLNGIKKLVYIISGLKGQLQIAV
jgi:nucleoside-diphosphate-sugar epimerase